MSHSILMQYLGFESKNQGPRIHLPGSLSRGRRSQLYAHHRRRCLHLSEIRYQDAPDVCSLKLKRELTANADLPSHTNFPSQIASWRITGQATRPNPRILYSPKPREDY
jgi:hypothetical protein